ncbi:MAG: Processing protease [Candidatus Doudnabacteria bacterium Gr01-1014_77]|uniref:Processing protease n=1 Tax=Candidatus Doudnabacteria bacterium Gr01-1014_77 TaxID=2017133 RepID=A0A554JDX2_9BACT|nr:MAG: Processing protease [Candidatus Doudnabacteria bacterium Gr01-1014_77]
MLLTHKTLKNGLNVLLVNLPDSKSVLFTILVKVGSRYETKEVTGISHFLEHVFFKGSKKYPKPTDISQIVDAIGGDFNASTSKEATEFYIKAEKHHFDLIFDVLSDMVLNPLFKEQELNKEKGVIIEEINQYEDIPASQVENHLERIMWPDSTLGWDILGTRQSIQKMNRSKVLKYKGTFYQPSNIILGISGNFDTKQAIKKIEQTWGKLKNKKAPKHKHKEKTQKNPNLTVIHKDTQQAHLALGFKTFDHASKKNAATMLLANVLGGNMSSRLFVEIREKRGLAYHISASNAPYHDTGNFTIHAGLQVEKTQQALTEILKQLKNVKGNSITNKELKRAKDFVRGKIALAFENRHRNLDWFMDHFAFINKLKSIDSFLAEVEAVTLKDIHNIAKEIFQDKNMSLAIIGPFKERASFEKELKI